MSVISNVSQDSLASLGFVTYNYSYYMMTTTTTTADQFLPRDCVICFPEENSFVRESRAFEPRRRHFIDFLCNLDSGSSWSLRGVLM